MASRELVVLGDARRSGVEAGDGSVVVGKAEGGVAGSGAKGEGGGGEAALVKGDWSAGGGSTNSEATGDASRSDVGVLSRDGHSENDRVVC